GGSAFGLDASGGVMEYLYSKGVGFSTGTHPVPIVCGAVLFDLWDANLRYPDRSMGLRACRKAEAGNYQCGRIGAGKGATVGKLRGPANAGAGGVGAAYKNIAGIEIAVLTAVNALGDVVDYQTNQIIAGTRLPDGSFMDSYNTILNADFAKNLRAGTNTTIGVVMTNAALTREQANKLAVVAHDGLALAIRPVHTAMDGDTMFALAEGGAQADFNMLCVLAVELTAQAVVSAVRQ
ncbi:MAG: P1 family peptidase, partial [Firmicutes bacterium]|nr:P1 family peptidase [Bacillota bacterium]